MKTIAQLLLACLCVSCAQTEGTISGYSRGGQPIGNFRVTQLVWGKLNSEIIPFGVTHSGNLDIGFKAFVNAVVALATAIYYGNLQMEKETTTQLANAGMTKVELKKLDNALRESLAKIGLDETVEKIKGGVFTP